ncbi:cyclic GMP-AMP synthase-like receptor isoform X2 [Neocloeon triangulifer]|nr:cyclic GMP-AMP synthase-like receptor isoform X2 [Neocloeon triangulifer]XP_059488578.1 cyclic GMP-AMP synthase-like receptor isoform X2 [Neocloeon triangulifer]
MGGIAAAPAEPQAAELPNLENLRISGYSGNVVQVLERVLRKLRLEEDEIKRTNQFIDQLVKRDLVNGLKAESKLFAMIYKEIQWTGSFYEGLKISKPDEFDLNIVFKFPFDEKKLKLVARNDQPGFVTVKGYGQALESIKADPKWQPPVYTELARWTDPSGNLLQDKVRQWMEGITTKFVNNYNVGKPINEQLHLKKSGPAMTLEIGGLSIDVVPVFGFITPPPHPIRTPKPLNRSWFIVPKPLKNEQSISDAWRVSFYQFEKDIIRDYGRIKPAIKLIKKLRDEQNWQSLYSYAIKNAALWMKESGELSENDNTDLAFIKLLRGIQKYLQDGFLPFYWEKRGNMLRMGNVERTNLANRITRLIRNIEQNWEANPAYIGELIYPDQ